MKIVKIVLKELSFLIKNKKLLLSFFLIYFGVEMSFSQITLKGSVVNEKKQPIPYASILVNKDSVSATTTYTYSNDNGEYLIKIPKKQIYDITYSSLGFKTQIIKINTNLSKHEIIKNIILKEEPFSLNEVIVTVEKPIKVKKDTIRFKTKFFTNGTEETVEDLLKKIPGLQIDSEGTIKVGNQEIEKLMVDGDDLFENGYKILSKNMPAYPIKELEILNNYSNNSLLKGVEKSDKVALNLKLDDKSKRIWFGNLEASIGNFHQLKGNLMNFGKKNKYYFLTNFNNTGYDSTGDIQHLIRPFTENESENIGSNARVHSLLDLSISSFYFKKSRTNFNNSKLATLNAIFNPTKKIKIKTLGFFNWDKVNFYRNSSNFVDVNGVSFINTEDYQLLNRKKTAFGKINLTYNISSSKMLESITKVNKGNFRDRSNLLFNKNVTLENLGHQNRLFDQKLTYTNKLNKQKVILLTSRFIDEKAPQNYHVNHFFLRIYFQILKMQMQ